MIGHAAHRPASRTLPKSFQAKTLSQNGHEFAESKLTVLCVVAIGDLVFGVVEKERRFEPVLQSQVGGTPQTKKPVWLKSARVEKGG